MTLKIVAVFGMIFVAVVGTYAIKKYAPAMFGKSSKAQLYLDEKGTCKYEGRSSVWRIGGKGDEQEESDKEEGLCTKIIGGKWNEVDLTNVEVYWGSEKSRVEKDDAKNKWDSRTVSNN